MNSKPDLLVNVGHALAEGVGVSAAVIGLTVVAAGTSAPELFVSATATALAGAPALALGNVVGSNIANISLILGCCALLDPIPFAKKVLRFEYPFLVLMTWIARLLCRDGLFDRLEAALKRHHEMAVSNVVGSNIFNLLLILGATGAIRPVPVEARAISLDIWAMVLFTVVLLPLVVRGSRLSRGGGLVLLALYATYLALVAAG